MEILYILLVILLVARAFGALAERLGQPALVGELISGMVLGMTVSYFSESLPVLSTLNEDKVFKSLTDLGVFFLMLLGGLEFSPRDLVKSSGSAFIIALSGFLIPLGAGFGLAYYYLPDSDFHTTQCLFVGTAMAITAVPVAIRVLMDLKKQNSPVGKIIVSAALFDDILSLLLLAILTGIIESGTFPGVTELFYLVLKIGIFFAVVVVSGLYLLPWLAKLLPVPDLDEFEFSVLLLIALLFAVLAEYLELHFILGAFAAGLFFSRRDVGDEIFEDVQQKVSAITSGLLAPVFFASIGLSMTVTAIFDTPLFLGLLIAVAFLSKFIGAGGAALAVGMNKKDSSGIGIAMSARGAVELIVADIALQAGLFSRPEPVPPVIASMFSSIVLMAIVTTIATPILLRLIYKREEDEPETTDKENASEEE